MIGKFIAARQSVQRPRRFVYVLRSEVAPDRYYVGVTSNIALRLQTHNSGGSQHTATLRPWRLVVALEFASGASALAFEKYLKSGSGRAFAKRHFV
jgi:predicted GIY-YIG superfamily endonuclease